MLYPVKGFGVINETHVEISLFSIALSDIILAIYIYHISHASIIYKTTLFYSNSWSDSVSCSFHDDSQNEFDNVAHPVDGSM